MKPLSIIKSSIVRPAREPEWFNDIPKMMRMREPRIWNMAYAAVKKLLADCDTIPKTIVTATALGALDETKSFLDGVFTDGFGSPRNFIASVHNSMAGKLALDFKITGPNLTVCDGQNSFASALVTTSLLADDDYPVCVLAIDERIELLDAIIPHLSCECSPYLSADWEEAAVAFLLDRVPETLKPYISASSPQPVHLQEPQERCSAMTHALTDETISILPLSETSTSFIQPAIVTYEYCHRHHAGNYCIGSYSPSAQAAAVVTLCV